MPTPTPLTKMADATAAGFVVIKRLMTGSRKGMLSAEEGHTERSVEALMHSSLHLEQEQVLEEQSEQIHVQEQATQPAPVSVAEEVPAADSTPSAQPVEATPVPASTPETTSAPYVPGTNPALEAKVYEMDMGMAACSAIMGKLAHTISPWDIKSHQRQVLDTKAQFDGARTNLKQLSQELLKAAAYTKDATPKLVEREVLLEVNKEQLAALQRMTQVHAASAARYRVMLAKIDQGKLARLESRGAAGGRFNTTGGEETLNMLVNAVDVMVEEHRETLQINAQLEKAKEDLTKRVKEIQDKMKNEMEVRDRELQQLRAAVKRANEEKEASITTAKEQASSQVAKRSADLKALQHRAETSKTEAEQAKAQCKALKASLDQATETLVQSQEEAKSLNKKLQLAKSQKDSAARDLEHARAEQAVVSTELRQLQAAAGPAKINSAHLNKDGAWPRVAFTLRGGKVLHSSACGNIDTSKCSPMEYYSAEELEGYLHKEGAVLCHTCRADPRF